MQWNISIEVCILLFSYQYIQLVSWNRFHAVWCNLHTCRSVKSNDAAISILRGRHKYLLKWNSCKLISSINRRNTQFFWLYGTSPELKIKQIYWRDFSLGEVTYGQKSTLLSSVIMLHSSWMDTHIHLCHF